LIHWFLGRLLLSWLLLSWLLLSWLLLSWLFLSWLLLRWLLSFISWIVGDLYPFSKARLPDVRIVQLYELDLLLIFHLDRHLDYVLTELFNERCDHSFHFVALRSFTPKINSVCFDINQSAVVPVKEHPQVRRLLQLFSNFVVVRWVRIKNRKKYIAINNLVRLSIINALRDILSELLQLLDNRNRFFLNGCLSLIEFDLCIGAKSHHLSGLVAELEELH
jgi:hypothetical protein